jgi:hypothetical protein
MRYVVYWKAPSGEDWYYCGNHGWSRNKKEAKKFFSLEDARMATDHFCEIEEVKCE